MKALIYVRAIDSLVRRWTSPRHGFAVALEIPRDNGSCTHVRRVSLINDNVQARVRARAWLRSIFRDIMLMFVNTTRTMFIITEM